MMQLFLEDACSVLYLFFFVTSFSMEALDGSLSKGGRGQNKCVAEKLPSERNADPRLYSARMRSGSQGRVTFPQWIVSRSFFNCFFFLRVDEGTDEANNSRLRVRASKYYFWCPQRFKRILQIRVTDEIRTCVPVEKAPKVPTHCLR